MALRKPSNFFENNNKSEVSESIKGTESFDTFQTYKKNVEKFDAISKFSGSLEDYNENVEKVNYLSQQLLGVQEEIKTLLTQEDLDRAMMSQLLVVEETAKDIQSRVKTINNERLVDIKENVKELTEQVNQFISIDVPKYKSLVINSENRSYSRYDEFEERISESINDIDSSVEQKYVEIDGRLNNFKTSVEENLSSIKVDVSKEVTTALESIESVNKNTINVVKAEFKETEVRTEEKINETEEKINEVIDSYKKDIEDLNAKVKLFTETEIPKYSNLLIETKLKSEKEVKDLEEEVLSKVNILSEKVQFISEGIPEKTSEKIQELKAVTDEYKEEIDSISKKYQSLYKDFKEREVSENKKLETYSKDIEKYHKRFNFLEETVAEDLEEIQNVLAASNKSYHASLETEAVKFRDKISEQMKGLEVDLVTNEKHIKKQNEHIEDIRDKISEQMQGLEVDLVTNEKHIKKQNKYIEDIREEIKGVFDKLQLDKLEEKNASLSRKVNYIQEVLEKFNEKEVLTESITEPATTNNSDPLTPTDQNFVTFDQLQSHYRLFLNRIQQQLSTLGGGGEVRLEFLDDIDRSTAKVDGKFLKYDSSLNKWVGATGGSGGGGGISGVSTTGTSGFNNVNVSGAITATSFTGDGSNITGLTTSLSVLTNDVGFVTFTNVSQLNNDAGFITGVSTFSGDYNDLSNQPSIPTNNNQLTNGAGFITGSDNTTGTSGGLTGTPDITVDDITAGSINVSGVATATTFSGSVSTGDGFGNGVQIGAGNDLYIYETGSDVGIAYQRTGTLFIRSDGDTKIDKNGSKRLLAHSDGAVDLYYANSKKLETTNTGVTITGTATADAFHTGAEGSAIRVTSNTISGPATLTIDPAAVGDNTGTVVIAGDLQIDGTTTTVNSTTMTVDDKNLELGTGAANDAAADGGGITIVSGEGNKTFNFEATGDNLGSSENLNIASGKAYKINNTSVLNATTLGGAVVNSSLTSVGTLGALTVSGGVSIGDSIFHTGDTDTAIRFPAADTFTVETAGSETARFTSSNITFKAPDGGSRYFFGEMGNSDSSELSLYNSSDAQKVRISSNATSFFNGGNVSIQNDSGKFTAGTGDDLEIYHDASNCIIQANTGDLQIIGAGDDIIIQAIDDIFIKPQNGENGIIVYGNASVDLFYDGGHKLATKSDGVNIIGELECDSLDVDGAGTFEGILTVNNHAKIYRQTDGAGNALLNLYSNVGSTENNVVQFTTEGNATFDGTVDDSKGDVRDIPQSSNSSQRTLVATDGGKVVMTSSGGWVIPTGVMSQGNTVTLLNGDGSDQTINATALNALYNTSDGANIKANTITLGGASMATIWFGSGTFAYISATNMTVS